MERSKAYQLGYSEYNPVSSPYSQMPYDWAWKAGYARQRDEYIRGWNARAGDSWG